jgi:hypothetical protein
MLALLYLAAMTYFGDRVSRSFYRFTSVQHRLATSFLVGLLLSTLITYLGSLAFARMAQPLIMGNLVFLIVFVIAVYKLPRHPASSFPDSPRPRPDGSERWDWICMAGFFILACWLIFATLGFKDDSFQIAFRAWSDFGANLSLSQSFALGHNFPPEHPFFPGELIKYHFLFWFQAANLEFLGLNLVWSVNLLSILSLLALLLLIMTFAEVLFESRVVARIAAFLFFFSSSLSYLPFLRSQHGLRQAATSILHRTEFLTSGYPYRGEDWGALTVDVFANQRHLISGAGIFFVVLIFLVDFYKQNRTSVAPSQNESEEKPQTIDAARNRNILSKENLPALKAFLFSGLLIGCLPYWNSAIFVAALIVLGCFLFLLPQRIYLACLIGIAVLIGLPQVSLLRAGNVATPGQSIFHWGYTLDHPAVFTVVKYLGWTFGFKWLLIFVALAFLSGFHRRLFLAFSGLLAVVFLFQLSTDVFNNHKLLNVWSILAGVYAAYALWRISKIKTVGVVLAVVLTVLTIAEGVIDLFPVHNDPLLVVPYKNDRLTEWLLNNTQPSDIFLTQTLLTHPILFTGRKIFLGYTLFAWTAGYNVSAREEIYRQMFQEQDVAELVRLLNRHKIAYVGIDDGVRENKALENLNERVYQEHFQKVFDDTDHHYANITIYKVPSGQP